MSDGVDEEENGGGKYRNLEEVDEREWRATQSKASTVIPRGSCISGSSDTTFGLDRDVDELDGAE